MRKLMVISVAAALVVGASYFLSHHDQFTSFVHQYVENGEFVTLKARYTPEQIMEAHQKELLVDNHHSFQEPGLRYHPYILMDVKYAIQDKKSREGVMLWGLVDGEMVLNTDTWEKTHGFEDAINAEATRNDFKVMYALAKHNGSTSFDQLQKDLHVEKEMLQALLESALAKHLIVQKGNVVQLHFQDPMLPSQPETKFNDWFVKKPYNHAQKVSSQYSKNQIQKAAQAAFGDNFAIRRTTEVFLPVYNIEVLNPDGSTSTTYWNALTGQKIPQLYSLRGW